MQGLMVSWWRRACSATLVLVATALSIAACGGGGGVGEGGTGTFVSGPISGFGSVHVGGIRFDDSRLSAAQSEDDDDDDVSLTQLQQGMVIAVEAAAVSTDAAGVQRAVADRIVVAGSLLGPVTDVNWLLRRLRVLGLPVRFNAATVFDEALREQVRQQLGLVGLVVEVWGYVDRSAGDVPEYVATYMRLAQDAPFYKARGFVREVDDGLVRLGDQTFDFSGVSGRPSTGDFVRLRVQPGAGSPVWTVTAWASIERTSFGDGRRLEVEGTVTAVVDARNFAVDGVPVVAAQDVAGLALGSYVEVEGTWRAGALRADSVEIKSDDESQDRESEWEGVVSGLNVDQSRFTLTTDSGRQVSVVYNATTTRFKPNGTSASDLANPDRATLEVKGLWHAQSGELRATEIEFE
jgi:hypothetical protein